MELKSMKVDPKSKEEMSEATLMTQPDQPDYPYGLRVSLDEDSMENLGLDSPLAVGTKVKMECEAIVTAASIADNGNGPEPRMEIQITDMGISSGKKVDAQEALYGG